MCERIAGCWFEAWVFVQYYLKGNNTTKPIPQKAIQWPENRGLGLPDNDDIPVRNRFYVLAA